MKLVNWNIHLVDVIWKAASTLIENCWFVLRQFGSLEFHLILNDFIIYEIMRPKFSELLSRLDKSH